MYIARRCRRESRDWIRWNRIGRWLQQQSAIHSSSVDFCRSHDVVEHQYVVLSPAGRELKPVDALLKPNSASQMLLLMTMALTMMMMMLGHLSRNNRDCFAAPAQTSSCSLLSDEMKILVLVEGNQPDDHIYNDVPTHNLDLSIASFLYRWQQDTFGTWRLRGKTANTSRKCS